MGNQTVWGKCYESQWGPSTVLLQTVVHIIGVLFVSFCLFLYMYPSYVACYVCLLSLEIKLMIISL